MIKHIFIIIFFVQKALAQQILTADEAIKIALENNYSIKIGKQFVNIAKTNNTKGNAGMLPIVTGNATKNFNISNTKLKFFDDKLPIINRQGVQNNTGNAGIGLVWRLYDGLGMFVARDQLGMLQKLSENNAKTTITNTIAQVLSAYFDVIRGEKRVKNLKKGLEISNDRMKLSKDRYEVGQGSKVDFLSAQVDYNQDKSGVIAAEQALNNTKINLNTLLVRNIEEPITTTDTIVLNKGINLETIKVAVKHNNPDLIDAKLNKDLNALNIKSQISDQKPTVDFVTGYNYNTNNNGAGAPQSTKTGQFTSLNYGLRASINIFDGYNQKRRIEVAKLNSEISILQEKALVNQLDNLIERNFRNYKNALELINLEKENYKIAYLNTEIAFERYRVGNSTSYELREVQRNAVAAETRLIEAEFAAKMSEIELDRLSGNFLK